MQRCVLFKQVNGGYANSELGKDTEAYEEEEEDVALCNNKKLDRVRYFCFGTSLSKTDLVAKIAK